MNYSKPYSRSFEAKNVTLEDGPIALEVIEALLVFAHKPTSYVRKLREQAAPLRAAIAAGEVKPVARAILATIRSVANGDKWVNDIRRFWESVETADDCLRGLDAVLVLSRGNGTDDNHLAELIRDATGHREAIVSVTHREPKREIRSARSWGKRAAGTIEEAAMLYWSLGEPLTPDWELLGEPRPPVRTTRHSSPKFPLPWES